MALEPESSCACPVAGNTVPVDHTGCPVKGIAGVNPYNFMEDVRNRPDPTQSVPLGTDRVTSSIPSCPDGLPAHQPPSTSATSSTPPPSSSPDSPTAPPQHRWVYPSEQMFYNAMRRKGWDPDARDMSTVVQIHNAVNEQAWREVCEWERFAAPSCAAQRDPTLLRFMGRPNDTSPKARLLNLLGFKLPFDRHDWVVDRCGEPVRYVIDFYSGQSVPGGPPAMHLDVRPALDRPMALVDRLRMQMRWVWEGRWMGNQHVVEGGGG